MASRRGTGLERVDRLSAAPVVGQNYLVPTVRALWCGAERYWPVMGRRHDDAEYLKVTTAHYHVDCRFVAPRTFDEVTKYDARGTGFPFAATVITSYMRRDIEWKKRRCYRVSHDYPLQAALSAAAFQRLYAAFAGVKCSRGAGGFICPHKQFRLGSIAPIDGVITCPLHGLRINADTGIVLGQDRDWTKTDSHRSQVGVVP